jgi:hypothetical protein
LSKSLLSKLSKLLAEWLADWLAKLLVPWLLRSKHGLKGLGDGPAPARCRACNEC